MAKKKKNNDTESLDEITDEITKSKKLKITPRFGLLKILSEQIYRSRVQPIIEYVRNGWDADADSVTITIKRDKIIIEDDGKGMDLETLEKFLYVGESPKPKEGITEKGRKQMGKWGIGNLSAMAIGEGYIVETTKAESSEKITYDINFKDLEKAEKDGLAFFEQEGDAKFTRTQKDKHGTRIEIYGIQEKYTKNMASLIDGLKKEIGKKMPLKGKTPKERIKVLIKRKDNEKGKKVPSYIEQYLKNAETFHEEFEVEDNGTKHTIKLDYWVTKKALSPEDSGIFPKINSEISIKDGHKYKPDAIADFFGLKHRVYGEFEADFLAPYCTAGGDAFKDEDDPIIKQIYSHINTIMRNLSSAKKKERQENFDEDMKEMYKNIQNDMNYAFNKEGFPDNIPRITPTKGDVEGEKKPKKRKPSKRKPKKNKETHPRGAPGKDENEDKGKDHIYLGGHKFYIQESNLGDTVVAEIDEDHTPKKGQVGNLLYINNNHPAYKLAKKQGISTLETYVRAVIVQELVTYKHITIEEKIIDGNEGLKEVKDTFGRVIARIATLKK